MQHGIIARKPDSFFSYFGWGSVARIGDHTLVAACSGERTQHVCPFGKTELFYSFDDGATWTAPMVVNDTMLDDRDAGIVHLGGQRLALTWFNHPLRYCDYYPENSEPRFRLYHEYFQMTAPICKNRCGSWLRISQDAGLTWGAPQRMEVSSPHGPAVLADGSLLYLGKGMYQEARARKDKGLDEYFYYDHDYPITAWASPDGHTWEERGSVPQPPHTEWKNFHEPHVIELPDGRLLGMIRGERLDERYYKSFTMFQTWSHDGGRTWSEPTYTDVSGSPPHLLRHSSGAIICVYGRREAPYGERAMVSFDDGATWSKDVELFGGFELDLGYPCSVELADGSIFTVYYQRVEGDAATSFLWTRWRLDEV